MAEHRTFCRICISACGIRVAVDDGRVTGVRGDPSHPLTRGYVCSKGRAMGEVHHRSDRLDGGFIGRGPAREAVSVDACHADLGERLAHIVAEHGVGAVGVFHGTGGFMDAAGSWATRRLKRVLDTDYSYSTTTVDAIAKTFVAEQMGGTPLLFPNIDEEGGRLLVFIGINPVVSHGHSTMYSNPVARIRAARARGPVVVLDPRRTETAALADHHLAARPGTDYAVLAFVIRDLLRRQTSADEQRLAARAVGVDELRAAVAPFDAATVETLTAVPIAQLEMFAAAVLATGRLAILTGTGSTMAVAGNLIEWMAWALMVLTDSFDQPGGMWFNPGAFMRLDRLASLPPPAAPAAGAPARPDIARCGGEWPAALIADEIEAGRLRALVVVGANLATALPDTARVEAALGSIETLVVIDTHRNETTDLATHVFACAGQLERPDLLGLELNASAVYQHYTSAVLPTPPSRPPAWRTLCHIGRSLGVDVLGSGDDPGEVSSEAMLERLARGESLQEMRDGDGIRLDAATTFGWVQQRLPRGRWDLAPAVLVEQLRQAAAPPPLALVPRRTAKRMNSQALGGQEPHEALLHPDDAATAGVADGDEIELQSRVGAIRLAVRVTTSIVPGAVSVQHGRSASNVNHLIDRNDLDLLTGMPRMSGTAVTVRRVPQ